jgi:hypothetical protein
MLAEPRRREQLLSEAGGDTIAQHPKRAFTCQLTEKHELAAVFSVILTPLANSLMITPTA